jgi:hypothetical protein
MIDTRQYKPFEHDLFISNSTINGQGLFTKEVLLKDTYLGISHIEGDIKIFKQGLIRTPLIGHVNHSKEANCRLVKDGIYTYLITNCEIGQRVELTTDYTKSECGVNYVSKFEQ